MNIVIIVVLVALGWSLLSVIVSLAIGAMAKARDVGATPMLDHVPAPGRMAPPARGDGIRTAV